MVNFRNPHVAFTIASIVTLFSGFSNAVTIREALQDQPNLTTFLELLTQNKALEDILNTNAPKTLFVPTNPALVKSTLATMPLADQQALVRYHILNGSHPAASFTAAGGATMKTYLEGNQFANLGGEPNVVFTSKFGDSGQGEETKSAQVFSGLGTKSAIEPLNITFDGGIIHAVDNLFSLPETCTSTATKAKLNSLLTALRRTNLTTYVDTTPGITCFAPSDAAFSKAGSPEEKLSPEALTEALKYHTLQGRYIGYSDSWEDGQELTTLTGDTVTVKRAEGFWWVNDVKVLQANVVTSNGVAHVLEGVLLLPQKTDNTTKPNTTTSATPSSNPTETQGSGSCALRATAATLLGLTLPIVYLLV